MRMSNQEVIEILLNEQKCLDRNDGVQCDRKCESCDLVMDVETIREAYSMAISALKAQDVPEMNVGDMVSRKAAIDALMEILDRPNHAEFLYTDEICKVLNELPSAQPEPQWIPVTERLPKEYGNYLISIHGEDEPDIGTINPNDKRGWSLCDANGFYWASDKKLIVTAWMPLPEPYRVERRTDD